MNQLDAMITVGVPLGAVTGQRALLQLDAGAPETWLPRTTPFLNDAIRYRKQRAEVVFESDSKEQLPGEHEFLQAVMNHYVRMRVNEVTIQTFAKRWLSHFCHALKRSPRWATSIGQPFAGMPAFVVSAGPSLDKNGALLAEAQKRGPVIAVNTSASACLYHNVLPDAVVACEAVNLSDHLACIAGTNTPVVIDITANPANWDVAENPWAMSCAEPNYMPYVLRSGGTPLPYTGSVACAAVALALYWGASPVVLIGQDCAYTGGRYYAKGTPYADLTTEVRDGLIVVHGRSKEQDPVSVLMRDSWGGGEQVPSDHAMSVFVDWFSTAADHHYIVNATEGGSRIEYTYELPLAKVLDQHEPITRAPMPQPEPSDTREICVGLLSAAAKVLADPNVVSVPHWLPLLNMYTCEMAFDRSGTPRQRIARRRQLIEQGATAIVEALT